MFGLLKQEDVIDTQDLNYEHPEGKYIYFFKYLGDGVFYIKSKGYIDDNSFKHQLDSGDKARDRLKKIFPDKKYHLIWDISEVSRISLIARHLIFSKLKSTANFGSVSIIGANYLAISFTKIIGKFFPTVKFFFFRSYNEAIKNIENSYNQQNSLNLRNNMYLTNESEAYSHFIDLWQQDQATILINNTHLKYLTKPEWNYESPDSTFKINIYVIEGNIVYYQCEGEAKPNHIDKIYSIIKDIFQRLRFSPTNRIYSVLNIKKLTGVSLEARKKTSYYEHFYHPYCYKVFVITSYVLKLLVKTISIINPNDFKHWEIVNSVDEAFARTLQLQNNNNNLEIHTDEYLENEQNTVSVPDSRAEMIELIKKQHADIIQLKKDQAHQIKKILEVTSRLTWDESCDPDLFIPDKESPYGEIFDLLAIIYKDFKEVIKEKTIHAQQLKESEDKYKNLVELANDIIAVYQDNAIQYVNSRVTLALGYKTEEIIGAPMYDYIEPEEIPRLQEFYKKRIMGDNIPSVYETILIHKDGHKVPASMSVGRIMYYNRPAVMIIARDISQKKKIEEELDRYRNHLEDIIRKRTEQLQKEITERRVAEESDRLKTAFLSNMSHEIRTPMNAIIAFSDYLKNMELTDDQREEYLNYIQSSGQSLLNLINDIIDISKIESKQVDIQLNHLNINKFLDELFVLFEETRKNKNKTEIVLKLNKPKDQISLYTDKYRLKQILSNLLDNALKFTEAGHIELGCLLKHNDVIFYVQDTGEGIPEDKMDLIFKRFGRLNSTKRKISGTGLGLAISKNLAILLNGKLWVDSKVGEGSTFYLKIPNYTTNDTNEPEPVKLQSPKTAYNWEQKKILIAEDEDLNFRVLQIAIARTGATIIRAKNGLEAVEIINKNDNFDIILMDIQMPEMDGYEAMSKIKQSHKGLPIIAQTAFALLEEKNRCIEIGFDDYVAKPIRLEELFQKIDLQFEKYNP